VSASVSTASNKNILNGLLLINKPTALSSHDVVSRVRKILHMKEVGHTGTLDPLASGLMVILLGEGTKVSDYILKQSKTYRVKVQLGIVTDSYDITGKVLEQKEVRLDPDKIAYEARQLKGAYLWPVPVFSAAKFEGKKLYEYAHQGITPNFIPQKEMNFSNVEVLSVGADYIEAEITCSKGSFIRSWAHELGRVLGVGGTVATLQRVGSAPFVLADALDLTQLEAIQELTENGLQKAFIPLNRALAGWKAITVKGKDERLIHNGQISYDLERRLIVEQKQATLIQETLGIKVISAETGQMLAIIEAIPNKGLKIRRVFKIS
jgi:tRNA pseudouridine55 synthase